MSSNGITVGQIVAENYSTATVFESFGIDFCCKGNLSLEQACSKKGIDIDKVRKALDQSIGSSKEDHVDVSNWPLDLIVDYIEKKHHRYVEERIPILLQYLDKLCKVHGNSHPELFDIYGLFHKSAGELISHMKKEEFILFPYVRKMMKALREGVNPTEPRFGTVENPISAMMHEHEAEGNRFEKIAALSKGYTPPVDACNTFKASYALLEEFQKDLHRHIHLENNILFPAAIKMEQEIAEQMAH